MMQMSNTTNMLKKSLIIGGAISIAMGAMMEDDMSDMRMMRKGKSALKKGFRFMSMVRRMM